MVTTCVIQLASAAPFGLMWWTKRVTLELPRPIHVAPAPGAPGHSGFVDHTSAGDDVSRTDRRVGDSRGVRPYQPGDLRHWIHWPSTAHTGSLMVREMEGPAARPVTVRAILPPDPDDADDAAQRAVGTVDELLSSGRSVILVDPGGAGRGARPGGHRRRGRPPPGPGRPPATGTGPPPGAAGPGPPTGRRRAVGPPPARGPGGALMGLFDAVKQANLPGPPEHSIVFRAAATMSVVVAIAACHAQGELSTAVAAGIDRAGGGGQRASPTAGGTGPSPSSRSSWPWRW